jgi:UDP-N-acetylmuramoyl-tripeptide--D-alanyl-D-alanine ligase
MSAWTDAMVAAALGQAARSDELLEHHEVAAGFTKVDTDTRQMEPGALFVAIRGETHDGHAYLGQAADAGARGAVVDQVPDDAPESLLYYVVPDTLAALGQLGRMRRRRLAARVCAVAGSNGKTTTKDLLAAVLGTRYRVHATPGNFNNLVGAPLTLLGAPDDTEIIIAEIGTNVPGEIARLAAMVEPDAVVITGISAEHLEGLGDLDGVLREETAVLPWLPRGGAAIVADEPPVLAERARAIIPAVQVAGRSERADARLRAGDVTLDDGGRVSFGWREHTVRLGLRGRHNASNALLALGIGEAWGVDPGEAVAALAALAPAKMRGEVHEIGTLRVIADCYNSNPASVDAALDLLCSIPRSGARVAVLGSMLEMGAASDAVHADAAATAAAMDIDLIVATGAFVAPFGAHVEALGDRLIRAADPLEAYDRLAPRLKGDELVLLKGSRGVALERLIPRFEEQWGVLHPHGEAARPRASEELTGTRGDAPSVEHTQSVQGQDRPEQDPPHSTTGA